MEFFIKFSLWITVIIACTLSFQLDFVFINLVFILLNSNVLVISMSCTRVHETSLYTKIYTLYFTTINICFYFNN